MVYHYLDVSNPDHSYFLGFVWGDGSLYRRKNRPEQYRLSIEISRCDEAILHTFSEWFAVPSVVACRDRKTNFSERHEAAVFRVNGRDFCRELVGLGLSPGRKARLVELPEGCDVPSFFRGLVDADGSLGLTGAGLPFVSLSTTSQGMADSYLSFLEGVIGYRKTATRNTRDGSFNIVVLREDAQKLVGILWPRGAPCLARKEVKAKLVLGWKRPASSKRRGPQVFWTPEEDSLFEHHDVLGVAEITGRSLEGAKLRRQRLRRRARPGD